jgi:hypothetical protein
MNNNRLQLRNEFLSEIKGNKQIETEYGSVLIMSQIAVVQQFYYTFAIASALRTQFNIYYYNSNNKIYNSFLYQKLTQSQHFYNASPIVSAVRTQFSIYGSIL